MKPTAPLVIAAPIAAFFATIPGALAFETPSTPEPELRFRFHASATHPGAVDAMAADALFAVQWSVPPEFFAVRVADGPVIALDLARHDSPSRLVVRDPEAEPAPSRLSRAPDPGLYTVELSLRPPIEDSPAALSGAAPIPAPAAWIILPLATLAAGRRR